MKTSDMKIQCRVMIDTDLPDLVAIDRSSFTQALPQNVLRHFQRFQSPCPRVTLVAECREDGPHEYAPVGFALYIVFRGRIVLSRLAVAPEVRGHGVGRKLVTEVQRRAAIHFVPRVRAVVPESHLSALQFARACGAKAVRLLRNHFVTEDGIELVLPAEPQTQRTSVATSVPRRANEAI